MKLKAIIFIVVFLNAFSINIHAQDNQMDERIKVGIYEYEPYFMLDDAGNMSGYYYDFMRLLQEKHPFEYEFVVGTLNEGLKRLADGEIDIMLGVSMNTHLSEEIIFNRYSTNKEIFGIFSDERINFEQLSSFTDLKLGMVEGDYNSEWVINLFEANDIDISIIYEKDYKTLEKLLEYNEIDLLVENKWKRRDLFLIYDYIGKDVYIAGHKESQDILESLDQVIAQLYSDKENPIESLYEQYFGSIVKWNDKIMIVIIIISFLVLALFLSPIIVKHNIQNIIRCRINKNQYILQYQPIYNPRNNTIVGFEGLLRLLDKNNKLIPPFRFIPEIEKNDMLFDVSLWIIKKVIDDYRIIKNYECILNKNFYLSLNLSLKEIENDVFVDKAINLLAKSNIEHGKICLEIIERFKLEDSEKIMQNIARLKQGGFKLAIDDFGVEYSNLDMFHKLNVDIIKVDKFFIDGIGKDSIREEVVSFISRLAHLRNQSVVLEGVEEANQVDNIKKIVNDRLFVQGYYYNKPMFIENIKKLKPRC